ncbi:uncharacterized protein LAESUDRAFT_309447 [Laetiporus sulphureus 93-53]|uniref:Uncharacterized protein n=1 Tax=Laetiporus sulphureus 93-53 TaxID=1314785 RepID=A0A165DA44_9APHY|nr:uncharacterized protein LAESUDRAFT_309447 [Laetiporus sulphureus 93-53]KZT04420.1 hypothetical protein LAESUDRAFT_309447 [Laetiporus sulphureus 93-53]
MRSLQFKWPVAGGVTTKGKKLRSRPIRRVSRQAASSSASPSLSSRDEGLGMVPEDAKVSDVDEMTERGERRPGSKVHCRRRGCPRVSPAFGECPRSSPSSKCSEPPSKELTAGGTPRHSLP